MVSTALAQEQYIILVDQHSSQCTYICGIWMLCHPIHTQYHCKHFLKEALTIEVCLYTSHIFCLPPLYQVEPAKNYIFYSQNRYTFFSTAAHLSTKCGFLPFTFSLRKSKDGNFDEAAKIVV
jgi:hypothetical protein